MARPPDTNATTVGRPKDRADRIVAAAAQLFSESGYDAVSLDDIGGAVGITGPAIYRYFSSKEALLGAVADQMLDHYGATYHKAIAAATTPEERLRALAHETIGRQVEQQNFWLLSLSDMKHLPTRLARDLTGKRRRLVALWSGVLRDVHPGLHPEEAAFMAEVSVYLTGSLVYYRPQLSETELVDVLTRMFLAAHLADLPPGHPVLAEDRGVSTATGPEPSWARSVRRASPRERILAAATPMFRENGFNGIGIDEIGSRAGSTGPAVYRHFKNKEDILFAILGRANELLAVMMTRALANSRTPVEALEMLIDSYLETAISDADLLSVYWGRRKVLSAANAGLIGRGECSYVDDWAEVLRQVRPVTSRGEARTMTYGALGMMNGLWHAELRLDVDRARPILRAMVVNALLEA